MKGTECISKDSFMHIGHAVSFPQSSLGCEIRVVNIDVNHSMTPCYYEQLNRLNNYTELDFAKDKSYFMFKMTNFIDNQDLY